MFSWKRPANLGVRDGRLPRCRRSPNCVSSQAETTDAEHYIAPLAFGGSMAELRRIVESMAGATVVEEKPDYLYAEFRTRILRFVDDVEIYNDKKTNLMHIRSASRLGRRDFGVNRKRVEALRSLIQARR